MSDFTVQKNGEQVLIGLAESLTAANLGPLKEAIRQELGAGARELVFDLSRTTAIDSSGLGLLIATSNSIQALQGGLRLEKVPGDIMKLLKSMRLVDRLHAGTGAKE